MNEGALNSYFFFWTSITYLPSFFFTVLILTVSNKLFLHNPGCLLAALAVLVPYNTEFVDFQSANALLGVLDTTQTAFNFLLTNNLNKYHPLIFYVSAVLSFYPLIVFALPTSNWRPFQVRERIKTLTRVGVCVVSINLFALYLGSWWAVQEGTWGGWWNWDASEVFGLLFTLFSLRLVHTSTHLTQYSALYLWVRTAGVVLVLAYFFIQLNFDLVSHNFGAKFFFFFSNNLFFLEVIAVGMLSIVTFARDVLCVANQSALIKGFNRLHAPKTSKARLWTVPFLYLTLTFLMVNSFLPLLNYFWWNFFKVNLFNSEIYSKFLIILVVTGLLLLSPVYNRSIRLSTSTPVWDSPLACVYVLVPTSINPSTLLHLSLLGFFSLNILSHDTSYIYFYLLDSSESLFFEDRVYYPTTPLLACDGFEAAMSLSYVAARDGVWVSNYNLIYHSNTPLVNSFTLLMTQETTLNLYHLVKSSLTAILYIETPLLSYLNLYTLTSFIFFYIARPER